MWQPSTLWVALLATATGTVLAGEWSDSFSLNSTTPRAMFSFTPTSTSGAVLVLLVDTRDSYQRSSLYYLVLQNSRRGSNYLLKCHGRSDLSDRASVHFAASRSADLTPTGVVRMPASPEEVELPGNHKRNCHFKMAFGKGDNDFPEWEEGKQYNFMVDVTRSSVRVWVEGDLYEWPDTPFSVGSYLVGTEGFSGAFQRNDSDMTTHYAENRPFYCMLSNMCKCLPGYEGRYCNKLCKLGKHGAGCNLTCGMCLDDSCDPVTGECVLGCRHGFFPPLCHNATVHFLGTPDAFATSCSVISVSADLGPNNLEGVGKPSQFQFQYQLRKLRMKDDDRWYSLEAQPLAGNTASGNITGLLPSTEYEVRLVLYTDSNATYDADELETTTVITKCKAPEKYEYKLNAHVDGVGEMKASWQLTKTMGEWCPIKEWRLQVRQSNSRLWRTYQKGESQFAVLSDLQSNQQYELRVQAVTVSDEELPPSHSIAITTESKGPGAVRNLEAAWVHARELELVWDTPANHSATRLTYLLQYECHYLLGCMREQCGGPVTALYRPEPASAHRYTLRNLRPHALYSITVEPRLMDMGGPPATTKQQTGDAAPSVAPERSLVQVENVTSTSFTVRWKFSQDCSRFNGYSEGMRYELARADGKGESSSGYVVSVQRRSFTALAPRTAYRLRLHLIASGMWDLQHFLELNVSTHPTGPEKLEKLTVFRKGQHEVSLRWLTPKSPNGTLQHFKVAYQAHDNGPVSEMSPIPLERCVTRPKLHCYTLPGLVPQTEYTIWVQALYSNMSLPGINTAIQTSTIEYGPSAPESLTILSRTPTSILLQWEIPDLLNGQLREFVITAYHVDTGGQAACCDNNLVDVMNVSRELRTFTYKVEGLRPASSYVLGVTGVTSVLGATANLTGHTAPAAPLLPPNSLIVRDGPGSCLQLTLPPVETHPQLVSSYMLLLVPSWTRKSWEFPDLSNSAVAQQLKEQLPMEFHIVNTLLQSQVPHNRTVCLPDPVEWKTKRQASGTVYRVGLALVLAYRDTYTVATVLSAPFSVLECFHGPSHRPGRKYMCF